MRGIDTTAIVPPRRPGAPKGDGMERQVLLRGDEGVESDEQIERPGTSLLLLERGMDMEQYLGGSPDEVGIGFGPRGTRPGRS